MQAMSHFSENYVEPVIYHPVSQFAVKLGIEVIKIIAAKIFLEYLGNCYLKNPARISKHEVYKIIIEAPIREEVFFRLVVLQGIHLAQIALNHFKKDESIVRIQLASTIFGSPDPQSDKFVITMYPPLMEEMLCQAYVHSIYWITKIAKCIFDRMYLASGLFANEFEQTDSFVIPINLPLEQELICRGIRKGISWINIPPDGIPDESIEENKKEVLQQIFRIHLAALIFAAAHLHNSHQNKTRVLTQFAWSYIGGVIYGYLSEKYVSLAPGVLAHGFNNILANAGRIYRDFVPFIIVALFVNRIVTYILAVTSIDRVILAGVGQATHFYHSLPNLLINEKNG
jgi:hypothetical protein